MDGALGVVGAVLLLVAVLLVNVLPETEVLDPQFRVDYESVPVELPISVLSSNLFPDTAGVILQGESNAVDVPYDLAENNIFELIVFVTLIENFPESLPDSFLIELLNPAGESVAISNPQPTLPTEELPDEQKGPGRYFDTPEVSLYRVAFNLGGKPEGQIVTFKDGQNGTLEDATAAIVQRDTRITHGTWTVRIWVESVGRCPNVELGTSVPSQALVRRAQFCAIADQQNHGGNGDTGNGFILNKLEYTYYDIKVSEA